MNDSAVALLLKFSQRAKQLSETTTAAAEQQQLEVTTPSPPQHHSTSLLPSFFDLLASLSLTYLGTLQAATSEQRLGKLGDFLEHELCAPAQRNWLEGWQVETDNTTKAWKFVTNEGIPLANFTEVAQFFNRSTFAVKLAELVDYLEFERKLPIQLKDWTCSPNLKKTKMHHPSVYSYQPSEGKVKQFYQLNLIGDFMEKTILTQFHRDRGNVVQTPVASSSSAAAAAAAAAAYFDGESEDYDDDAEARGGSDSESSIGGVPSATMAKKRTNAYVTTTSASAQMPNPVLRHKWMKHLKAGDAVLVQAKNNAVFHAIICPIPQGERTYDPVEKDVCFSVYYTTDGKHEHGVVARRIQGTRKETKEDMRVKQGALKGLLDADLALQLQEQAMFGAASRNRPIPLSSTNAAPPSSAESAAKRTQSEEVSKLFLDNVKSRIGKTLPLHFHNLVNMVKEVSRGAVSMLDLRDFVLDLFGEDDADLALQFSNGFLPPDLRITAKMLRNRHVEQAQLFQIQKQEFKRFKLEGGV